MDRSILPGKLVPPALPALYLSRPRLARWWENASGRRLLLVSAGAGYGKTSLLVECLTADRRPAFWYRVDEGDAHLPTFAAHLCELAGSDLPDVPPGEAGQDPAYPRRVLAGLVAALRARGPSLLVFDDAHLLSGQPAALRLIEELGSYLPAESTLVIAAREPLPLGVARARSAGEAAILGAGELVFDATETAALFALRFPGHRLGPAQARRVVDGTEGWAAGLEIFFQSLEAPVPSAVERALDHFTAAGAAWFDYLAEEVLAHLETGTREFLLRSSVLPRLEPSVCDRVLGHSDSETVLEDLVRRNLFTLREGGAGRGYRYHRLFHAFLEACLQRERPVGDLRALRRRAAVELSRSGDAAGALELFVQAGDVEPAARILGREGVALLQAGRREAVERGLACVPARRRARSPDLLHVEAGLADDLGRWDAAETLYRRVLRLRPTRARRLDVVSRLGQLISRRGEYAKARTICLGGLKDRRHGSTEAQGRLLWTLGVSACELGKLDEGEKRLEEARALFRRRDDSLGEAQVDYLLAANVHLARGDFRPGQEKARRALARLQNGGDPRRTCQCLGVLAWLTALAGDAAEARYAAGEARRSAVALEFPQAESMALHVLGRCALLEGDPAAARAHLEACRALGDALSESDARILSRLLLAECALRARDNRSARRFGREALALASAARDPLQEAQSRTLLGALEGGRDRAASRRQWARAESLLRRLGARFDLHRLLLLRLAEDPPRAPLAAHLLDELLSQTENFGHDALFLAHEPDRAVRVLARALAEGIGGARAERLLAGLGGKAVGDVLSLAEEADDALRERAVDLLAQAGGAAATAGLRHLARQAPASRSAEKARAELARIPAAPLSILTLGCFRVSVGTAEVPPDRWRSGRARRLFQYLLVRGFRWVEGEELLEALWPEVDPDRSRASLWQAVFRLRRILEPGLTRNRVSCYVRVEETRYRLEPGEAHRYDAADFENRVRDADRLASAGRQKRAEEHYRDALELYRGEFLSESPYEDFLLPTRERLREIYVHAARSRAMLLASARRWEEVVPLCRVALEQDPYDEQIHAGLVEGLLRLGHRREAIEAFRRFEERVVSELGLLRSDRMQALARQMRPEKSSGSERRRSGIE